MCLLVAISLSVTLPVQPYTFRTPLFFPSMMLSTWVDGTGPALLAVLLATLSIWDDRFHDLFGFAPEEPCTFDAGINCGHPTDRLRLEGRLANIAAMTSGDRWRAVDRVLHPGLAARPRPARVPRRRCRPPRPGNGGTPWRTCSRIRAGSSSMSHRWAMQGSLSVRQREAETSSAWSGRRFGPSSRGITAQDDS